MERETYRRRGTRFGGLVAGLALVELGVLLFLREYVGIPWSELWPLILIVPGVAVAVGALKSAGDRDRHDGRDRHHHEHRTQ